MKKFLLLAVVAITACAASAQMNLTKAWQTTAPALANTRQGIAMDGKFLINDKVQGKVFAYDENGAADWGETGATAAWPAIAKDEAGNVIVRVDNSWPGSFMADTILFKIFPAGGGDPVAVEGNIFADFEGENGRMDYLGSAEGNLLQEGALYIVTAKSTGILKVPFVDGEIDGDHIALIPANGASSFANSGAVVEPWTAADGTKHYMLFWRGITPYDMVLNEAGDEFTATAFTLPDRANLTGIKPFSRDGKDLVVYSLKPADRNYGDGWAIAEMNAEEPLFSVEDTGLDLNNGGICVQWFDIDGNKLFQYAGANYIACYEFEGAPVEHTYAVCGAPAAMFSMENDWDPVAAPEMQMNDNGLYEWTSAEVAIPACDIAFKVVQDHAWDVCFPQDNYVIPAVEAGTYTLNVTYNPETNEVNAVLTPVEQPVEPVEVYIIGEVDGNQWATNVGVKMDADEDHKIFTKEVVLDRGVNSIMPKVNEIEGNLYCYFSFATKLMEAADDWDGLAPYRFGAVSETSEDNPNGDFRFYKNMMGQPLALTFNNGRAFQVEEGTYTLTVDYEAMTLTIVGESKTAIETINLDNQVKSGRYNLLGQPVNENYKGIVIENGVKKIQR